MSWPMIKFSEAISRSGLFSDGDWVESKDQDPEGDVRLIQLADIGVGEFIDKSNRFMTSKRADELRCSYLKAGDILVARMPDPIGRACIFPEDMGRCVTVVDICIVRPDSERIDNRWLMHLINSERFRNQIDRHVTGTTRQRISRGNLAGLEIPLPPLPEQKRIAAILDKADAIRRKRQQAIQLADDFLRAVFLDMFGELVTSSGYANSQKYKLLELVDYIDYRGKTPEKSESGIPLITAKNVKSGYVDDEPREYIPEENYDAWMTRGFPRKNDVLFTTEAPLGNVALLGEYEKVAIGQRLVALRSKGKVTHEYLLFLLLHPFIQDLICARSSGSTVKGIRTKELYAIELPVPDMQKQREFSAVYWKSKSLRSNQESAHQLDVLNFSALSQKAFAGQL
ncbi:TPA: restriction endonuclease subunit S [Pseudomonas aeruginosa]|uniref:restriction endonuclease subunit S n=2 Tax=Pseudomonas TaxID=286 RepID=UPI0025B5E6EB|nr:restriction endonuclease subunit S [Pseudomonas aeruginosa]HCR9778810.1 restriction endonuclease subunit S [Pseudomonas aeruginosa]